MRFSLLTGEDQLGATGAQACAPWDAPHMTGAPEFVVRGSGAGEAIRWRAEMLVKAAAEETGGAYSLIETVNPPDAGPPLHLHHGVDEAFYVLGGTYEFVCGDSSVGAGPGAFVLLPRGSRTVIARDSRAGGCSCSSRRAAPRATSGTWRAPCRART